MTLIITVNIKQSQHFYCFWLINYFYLLFLIAVQRSYIIKGSSNVIQLPETQLSGCKFETAGYIFCPIEEDKKIY